jgi:hypothetical protein
MHRSWQANNRTPSENAIDIFLIAGQSNAVGAGTADQSPRVSGTPFAGEILQFTTTNSYDLQSLSGVISDANDPVCGAQSGSAWPSFGTTYNALTGRKIGFVSSAVGDAPLIPQASKQDWSSTGVLFPASIKRLNAALTAFAAVGYTPIVKGILWCGGETDAGAARDAVSYHAALVWLIKRYRNLYPMIPFYIFETGSFVGSNDDSNWHAIRAGQAATANSEVSTHIVFGGAKDFLPPPAVLPFPESPPKGSTAFKDMMASRTLYEVHYSQSGYNEMGIRGAWAVAVHAGAKLH